MISIIWDDGFKRRYKKLIKQNDLLKEKFWAKIELFQEDVFNPVLRTHKLSGKLRGLWAFSIDYYYRVVFKFISDDEVLLIDFGTHQDIY